MTRYYPVSIGVLCLFLMMSSVGGAVASGGPIGSPTHQVQSVQQQECPEIVRTWTYENQSYQLCKHSIIERSEPASRHYQGTNGTFYFYGASGERTTYGQVKHSSPTHANTTLYGINSRSGFLFSKNITGLNAKTLTTSDAVYSYTTRGVLLKLNATTGQTIWRKNLAANQELPRLGWRGTLRKMGGALIVYPVAKNYRQDARTSETIVINTTSGTVSGRFDGQLLAFNTPKSAVLMGGPDGRLLVGVNRDSGSIRWQEQLDTPIRSYGVGYFGNGPNYQNNRTKVLATSENIVFVDARTGEVTKVDFKGPYHSIENLEDRSYIIDGNPLIYTQIDPDTTRAELLAGNGGFAGDRANAETRIYQYYTPSGTKLWERTFPGIEEAEIFETALIDDRVVINSGGDVLSLNPSTGETQWRHSFGENTLLRMQTDQSITVVVAETRAFKDLTWKTINVSTGKITESTSERPGTSGGGTTVNTPDASNHSIQSRAYSGAHSNITVLSPAGETVATVNRSWMLEVTDDTYIDKSAESRHFEVLRYTVQKNHNPRITVSNRSLQTGDNVAKIINITDDGVLITERGPDYDLSWEIRQDGSEVAAGSGNINHEFQSSGEYNLSISVTDPTGLKTVKNTTVSVQEKHTPTASDQRRQTTTPNDQASTAQTTATEIPGFTITIALSGILIGVLLSVHRPS